MDLHESILKRGSVRDFDPSKQVPADVENKLLDAIKLAPTSSNWFSSTAIVIKDREILEQLGSKSKWARAIKTCSMFVVFVADFNRMNLAMEHYPELKYNNHATEGYTVAVGDSFIQATMLQDIAISNGLGTCFLGLVRTMVPDLIEALNIEGQAFPVIGLAIGYPTGKVITKPKLNRVLENKYDLKKVQKEALEYNDVLISYYKKLLPDKKPFSYLKATIQSASHYNMNTKEIEEIWDLKLQK